MVILFLLQENYGEMPIKSQSNSINHLLWKINSKKMTLRTTLYQTEFQGRMPKLMLIYRSTHTITVILLHHQESYGEMLTKRQNNCINL